MGSFTVAAVIGLLLGFLFGVGCAAAVLYTIYLSGYRAALRDAAGGGTAERYLQETRKLQRESAAAKPS